MSEPTDPRPVFPASQSLHRITCQIRTSNDGIEFDGVATGFFFRFPASPSGSIDVIVTNRHVVKDAKVIAVRLAEDDQNERQPGAGREIALDTEDWVIEHPDAEVDLAVLPFWRLAATANTQGWVTNTVRITPDLVPSRDQELDFPAASRALMVGYPVGIIDEYNNLPIVRQGVLATPYWFDYRGRPEVLADIASFEGSSGSPVLSVQSGVVVTRAGVQVGASTAHFLGVLSQAYGFTEQGELAAEPVPTHGSPTTTVRHMVHLAVVIKAREVLAFGPILQRLHDEDLNAGRS